MNRDRSSALLLLGCAVVAACGGIALTPDGTKVEVDTANPSVECREVGHVSAHAIGKDHEERNKTLIRNSAAEKGAEYVRLESNTEQGGMTGTAFHCPEAKPEAPPPPMPPELDAGDSPAPPLATADAGASSDPLAAPAAPKRKPKPKPKPAPPPDNQIEL